MLLPAYRYKTSSSSKQVNVLTVCERYKNYAKNYFLLCQIKKNT